MRSLPALSLDLVIFGFRGEENISLAHYNKIRFQKPTLLFLHFDNARRPHAKLYGRVIVTFSLVCALVQFHN